ncbi:MAG: PAS domain-containing protein [Vicinamibacterales bacterium]
MTAGTDRAAPPPSSSRTPNALVAALFVVVALVASGGAVLYYRGESTEVYDDARAQLETVARLKLRQIESWRMERLGDGEVLWARNASSQPLLAALRDASRPDVEPGLRQWLATYLTAYHQYDRLFIVDTDGRLRLSMPTSSEMPAPTLLDAAARSVRTGEISLVDFYLDPQDSRPHLALVTPIVDAEDGNTARGALILRIDPVTELYPVLEIEENSSRTGETELVRRDGQDVLFLNPLRFAHDSALRLRTPIADSQRLAALAAGGATGHVRGVDYRDAEVLGYITPVTGSPWLLVTRIDISELDAQLSSHLWLVTTGVVLLLASTGFSLGFWRRDQRLQAIARQAELSFQLRDSEERLRLALSCASQGLYDLDLISGQAIVNDEYALMLGHEPGGFAETLESWTERLHPEDRLPSRQALDAYLEGRTPSYRVEVRMRTAAGGWKWILSAGQVVARNADGRPRRMIGTHTDITPLKWAQEGQVRAMTQLRNLLANSPTVVYSIHRIAGQLRQVAVSENVERILGFTPAEVMQPEFWPAQVHPDDSHLAAQVNQEIQSTDETVHEYRFRRRDGRHIWVQDRLAVIRRSADGIPIEMAGALSDITLQHEAELALRSSEERLRLAMASARQGLWDLFLDTGATITSPEYAAMLGYAPGSFEETAAAWNARVHPDDFPACQAVFQDYVEGRREDYVIEFRQRTADGTWIWIHSTGRIIERAPDGRPLRMLGIHTDITARKEAELAAERLSGLYRTLSRCNEAIVRSGSLDELFDGICQAVIEFRDFDMAWVGVLDRPTGEIRKRAAAGAQLDYLDGLTLSIDPDTVSGRGPFGLAIRTNAPFWFDDVEASAIESPMMTRIRMFKWSSMGAVPLMRDGATVAALGIYSRRRAVFDEDARRLLVEMSANISFALDAFARDERRKEAEARLQQSEARYRTLFAESSVPMLLIETDSGNIADANAMAADYFGYSTDRLRRMNMRQLDTIAEDRVLAERVALVQQPRARLSTQVRLASGELRDADMFVSRVVVDGHARSLALVADTTERNRATTALAEKEFQLVEAQRVAHVGSFTSHSSGRGYWSEEMFRLHGLSIDAPLPSFEAFLALVHPDDRERVRAAADAQEQGATIGDCEFRAVRPDGSIRHLVQRGEVRTAPDGSQYVAGTVQDITDRKNAEQALRESEERLRLALGAVRQGLWDVDVRAGTLLVSPINPDGPGFLDTVVEMTREAFIGAFHPDDRTRAAGVFQAFMDGSVATFDEEFRLLLPDGSVRWTHSTGEIVERDDAGRATRIIGVARDISERHAFLEAVRLRDRALESSQSAVAIGDLAGRISYVNRAFVELWELSGPADAVGASAATFLEDPAVARDIVRALHATHAPWTGELVARTATGTRRDVLASAAFVTDEHNAPIGLVAAFIDITGRKRAEQAVAASLREKEALLKEVHHRVKNNLQVISSLLRLELGRTAEPGVRHVLGEMQNRVLSMALLHETLYRSDDLSRVDLSRYLDRLVQQVFRSVAPSTGRVTLQVSLVPASVDLEQAVPCGLLVTELISNSLKHAFPDNRAGEVRVSLEPAGDEGMLRLAVEDTGIGLPADFDARRARSLGLVLVSDLARQLRGTLTIGAGTGASFTLLFRPRQAALARPPEASH